jgi:drug/metabolite transporter (DMT)-like permease
VVLAVVVGLVSAIVFGGADFLGGLASKRLPAVRVTATATFTGFILLLVAVPVVGGVWTPQAVLLGVISGVSGAVAISLLYACLAIGPMSILSPLTAVVSAAIPVAFGLLGGERLPPIGYLAIAIAFIAIVLVGFVPEKGAVRPALRGVIMAIGSGIAIGIFLIVMDLTPKDSGLVPLVLNRGVESAIMFATVGVIALAHRRRGRMTLPVATRETTTGASTGLRLAIACGIADVFANGGVLFALHLGDLSVISVLTALYPIGTIILAAIVLKERIAPVQYLGLVLAIGATAMLALA